MINIPYYIKEALDVNDGNNHMAAFLRSYYSQLLGKADEHKRSYRPTEMQVLLKYTTKEKSTYTVKVPQ